MTNPTTEDLLDYSYLKRRIRKGNAVQLLRDGTEAFPAMLSAIAEARRFISIEFYIWRADDVGWRFADALVERHRAGVRVRAMYDALGCIDVDPIVFETLRGEGIDCQEFRPYKPWRPRWGILRRDHRKILVVDNEVGFTGGINLAREYLGVDEGGHGWRDAMVRLEGPAVNDLNQLFMRTWRRERKGRREPEEAPRPSVRGDQLVSVLGNTEIGRRQIIRKSYLQAIRRARATIDIANAYFLPDRDIRRAMYAAVRRGVRVRIMVPLSGDVPMVSWATQFLFARLLRRGVQLFQWTGTMIHAKTAVIDAVWSTIGSYNLDHKSLRHNLEVNVNVLDATFGREMVQSFEADLERCRAVVRDSWSGRGWFERLRSWFFFQFRWLF